MSLLLGQNGLVVCSVVITSAIAANWILRRVVPIAVGGTALGISFGLAIVVGAWRWMTGSLDLEEEELGRAITRQKKSEKPCDGQLEHWPNQRKQIEVNLDDDLETIKREIENALS